jgi:hypothetical protein
MIQYCYIGTHVMKCSIQILFYLTRAHDGFGGCQQQLQLAEKFEGEISLG